MDVYYFHLLGKPLFFFFMCVQTVCDIAICSLDHKVAIKTTCIDLKVVMITSMTSSKYIG